ncbi:hypothetical protein CTAM01_11469 [Colletotrichum tamarilloi]|uniref:F-box domain-containing protein n=1 Tax=Colletotrichum tamarilloi TaxID=1209934 RepID=A0ABQ9QXL7_9PEZI|nr:uncharacterized protein CTAM01_11469 [Colletotrichum tamarilloi]KAK1488246.1 hypothetical protein CTAM01_11469 [Colletotrichum tamarilloi]
MSPHQLRPALPGCAGPDSIPTEIFFAIIEAFLADAKASSRAIEWRLEYAEDAPSNFRLALTGDVGYPGPLSIHRFRNISIPLQINKKCRELTSRVFIPIPSLHFYLERTGPDIFVLPYVDLFRVPKVESYYALPEIDAFSMEDEYFQANLEGIRLLQKVQNIILPTSPEPGSRYFQNQPANFCTALALLPNLRKVVCHLEPWRYYRSRRSPSALPSPRPSEPVEIDDRIDLDLQLLTSKFDGMSNWEFLEKKKVRLYVTDGEGGAEIIQTTEGFKMKYLTPDETKDCKFLSGWMIL